MGKAAREKSARDKLAEQRKRQAKRDLQVKILAISVGAVVLVAAVVVGAVLLSVQEDDSGKKAVTATTPTAKVTREADGSIVVAKDGVTAPTLELYEDFQCPACQQFEKTNAESLTKLANEGKVKVIFRPFQLFQQDPMKGVSRRGGNAAICTPPDKWLSMAKTLYKYQPAEGKKGFSNDDLVGWGKDLGITDPAFEKCVNDGQKLGDLDKSTQAGTAKGVEGTPSVFLDGKKLDQNQTGAAMEDSKALEQIIAQAPKTAPSPTPSKKQ